MAVSVAGSRAHWLLQRLLYNEGFPGSTKIRIIPSSKPRSPIRFMMKACLLAAFEGPVLKPEPDQQVANNPTPSHR